MRFIVFFLQIFLLTAKISLNRFNTGLNISAIYQLANNSIILGTYGGKLMMYNANGSFINRIEGHHKSKITSIVSFHANQTQFIAASDYQGLVSILQANGRFNQLIKKNDTIQDIKVVTTYSSSVLAICTAQSIYIHQIPSLKMSHRLFIDQHSFKKMLVQDNKLYLLTRTASNSSIYVYDQETNALKLVMTRYLSYIKDFAVVILGMNIFVSLLGEHPAYLEIYRFNGSYQIADYVNKSENNPRTTTYHSLISLPNDEHPPLFVADTDSSQLQFYNGFNIRLYLQLSPFKIMHSSQNRRLVIAGYNGQVSYITIVEGAQDSAIEEWIILLTLSLLALGLYLCCGDCWPGVIRKWRRQRERQEIQLQLYRQRTQLQNF